MKSEKPRKATHLKKQVQDFPSRRTGVKNNPEGDAGLAKQFQSTLADISQAAIITTDKELYITNWNKTAETLFGWHAEEVLGKRASTQIRAKILDFLTHNETLKGITENGSWKGKTISFKKDGSQINTLVSISILWDSAGDFNGLVSIHHEIITPEKKKETPVAGEFELKVKEHTEKLTKFMGSRDEQNNEFEIEDNGELSKNDFIKLQGFVKELTAALTEQVSYFDKHIIAIEKLTDNMKQLDATIKKEIEVKSQQPPMRLKEALIAFMDYNINPRFYQETYHLKLPSASKITHPGSEKQTQNQN